MLELTTWQTLVLIALLSRICSPDLSGRGAWMDSFSKEKRLTTAGILPTNKGN